MPITFQEALARATESELKVHALLGNGFSRACRDHIFAYDALFEEANFDALSPLAKQAFDALNTKDFEVVMRALRQAASLVEIYLEDRPDIAEAFRNDADGLRDLLARTIAGSHPDRPSSITRSQYEKCRNFLSHFDSVHTVNYDLLLYWAVMQEELEPPLKFDDGFRQPDDGPAEYVTWDVQKTGTQNLHYLHGALHIFDAGAEIQKYTWVNTQVPLVDQIRAALGENRYPLFVAEGTAEEKMVRIQHSGLLNRAYRSFSQITGALFVYGLSMSGNDEHILKLIEGDRSIKQVYVSLYGDPESEGNRRIITRANGLVTRRTEIAPRKHLLVEFYDAESAHVWS